MPSTLANLASRVRNTNSAGGERVYLSEARTLINEANRNGIFSAAERDVLEGVVNVGNLTRSARTLLESTIGASSSSRPTATTSGTVVSADDNVGVNSAGKPTVNGRASTKAWNELAETLAEAWVTNDASVLKQLSVADKKKLLKNAINMVEKTNGSSKTKRQLRSSAFSVAFAVASSLPKSRSTKTLVKEAHQALMAVAQSESHPRLAKHMVRLLCDKGYQKKLSRADKADVKDLFEATFPQKFDVGNILDSDGYIQWEHNIDEGENMFRSFILNIRQTAIGGRKFKVVKKGDGYVDLEVTFRRGRGEDGRVKGIKLRVKEHNFDMFDSVGKPVGISFGGHSNTGNNQEKALKNALKKGIKADKPQFIYLDLCAGLDGLDDGLEGLGNVEILTTLDSSLYTSGKLKDENGKFKGIDSSEMQPVIFQLWEGLSREEDYGKMRNRVKRVINAEDHPYDPNYIFGTEKDYKDVRWAHLDGDDDGVMDALDLHYRFGVKNPTKSINFTLKHNIDANDLNGDTVRDAVLDVNVSTHYNAFTHHADGIVHNFISGGFFDGKGTDELVRFSPVTNANGKRAIGVQVNSGLAHTSREALGALVHYATMLELCDSGVLGDFSEKEAKLNAIVFAAARLICDGGSKSNDERIWKKMLKAVNLPNMPFKPLAARLNKEHNDYTGNSAIANGYNRKISAAARKALKDPTVGRVASASNAIA